MNIIPSESAVGGVYLPRLCLLPVVLVLCWLIGPLVYLIVTDCRAIPGHFPIVIKPSQ